MSEAMQRPMAPMPAWLVFSGAAIGIVGASVTKHAENVGELILALDSRADPSNLAAVTPGEWGVGLLIVGAVVALSGLVVAARRANLNIIESVTATCMESATSRVREPRQNALIFGPTRKTHMRITSAGSVGGVRGTCHHHAAQADPARPDRI
ncbi:MAG TPA: hypothetical protein VF086_05700 [Propionibacteriaceae bacterium]